MADGPGSVNNRRRHALVARRTVRPYMTAQIREGSRRMKLKRLVASTAAALSLSLAGCATVARPPAGALPGPALWQVADEDTTIYLFGTVHALPEGKQWFDGRIDRAFSSADELVTEIDVSDAAKSAEALQSASLLPEGQSLRS